MGEPKFNVHLVKGNGRMNRSQLFKTILFSALNVMGMMGEPVCPPFESTRAGLGNADRGSRPR